MRIGSTITLSLVPALVLSAQAPTLGQKLVAEQPEIEKLLVAMKAREAFARAEALVPASVEPFDKKDAGAAMQSNQRYRVLTAIYTLAGRTAFAAGYWDKALDYQTKALNTSKENAESTKAVLSEYAKALRALMATQQHQIDDTASYIAELKAKPELDAGDKQQIEMVEKIKADIPNNEKYAVYSEKLIEDTAKEAPYYQKVVDATTGYIKDEAKQLEEYKFSNDKAKYVEGIISSAKFMSQFEDKRSKAEYLYRLNVLSPENKKVQKEIDILLGKASAEAPAKKKKKG